MESRACARGLTDGSEEEQAEEGEAWCPVCACACAFQGPTKRERGTHLWAGALGSSPAVRNKSMSDPHGVLVCSVSGCCLDYFGLLGAYQRRHDRQDVDHAVGHEHAAPVVPKVVRNVVKVGDA
jgi:hypothetical protein